MWCRQLMLTLSLCSRRRPEFEKLPSFPRSGGGGSPLDPQTEKHEKEYSTSEQMKHVDRAHLMPYMALKGTLVLSFFLPCPDFQSKTFVPLTISTETELIWHRTQCLQCIYCTLYLIHSSECILNSLVFQEMGLGYNLK